VSCASPVTISVKDDLTTPYNVTDFVTESPVEDYETSLSLSRDTFTASVEDIGTSFIVTATASFTTGPLIGTESTCSFMVNFEGRLTMGNVSKKFTPKKTLKCQNIVRQKNKMSFKEICLDCLFCKGRKSGVYITKHQKDVLH